MREKSVSKWARKSCGWMKAYGILDENNRFHRKDVENANETKRASVIMRSFLSGYVCLFFWCRAYVWLSAGNGRVRGVSLLCLIGYVVAFGYTYRNRTKTAMWYTFLSTISWVLLLWCCLAGTAVRSIFCLPC